MRPPALHSFREQTTGVAAASAVRKQAAPALLALALQQLHSGGDVYSFTSVGDLESPLGVFFEKAEFVDHHVDGAIHRIQNLGS